MATENTAATQSGDTASGQAAGAQQGAQTAAGQQATQAGQTSGQQEGSTSSSPQSGTTTTTTAPTTTTQQPAAQVPARYELTLPERSPLDQADVTSITEMAKQKSWTTEQAQEALNEWHASVTAQHAAFRSELDSDLEVGGAHLERAQVLAKRVLDRFLPTSHVQGVRLREAMNKSGYGNYLPLVMLLSRIGKAMSEDQPGFGAQSTVFTQTERSLADRLFGDAQGVRKGA